MLKFDPGLTGAFDEVVTPDMGTSHAGPPILSTPSMILMIETACGKTVLPYLEGEETTVGVHVNVSHRAPAVPGDRVDIAVEVVAVEGRFIEFEVEARVGDTVLGAGMHRRAVVDPARSSKSGAPAAPSFPEATRDLDQAKRDFDRWGYCLLANALSPEQVGVARQRLVEQAAAEAREGVGRFDSGRFPSRYEGQGVNQRVSYLINKGAVFHEIALHRDVGQILQHALGDRYLLTSFTANITAPGCEAQMFHQDQGYVCRPQPRYPVVTQVIWMLDDVNERNGATRVLPGSNHWEHQLDGDPALVVQLDAPAGTAAIVGGRTWHAAGANKSDGLRHVLLSNYCRIWVRQQENPFLSIAPEVEAALSPGMKRLLGYKIWGTLGGVGEREAVDNEGYVHRPDHFTVEMS